MIYYYHEKLSFHYQLLHLRLLLIHPQKLHLKLLTHCLEVFKDISLKSDIEFPDEILIKKWCENEAKKLNDESFSVLLFEQMNSAAEKLKEYSKKKGKYPLDLILEDLVDLISLEN